MIMSCLTHQFSGIRIISFLKNTFDVIRYLRLQNILKYLKRSKSLIDRPIIITLNFVKFQKFFHLKFFLICFWFWVTNKARWSFSYNKLPTNNFGKKLNLRLIRVDSGAPSEPLLVCFLINDLKTLSHLYFLLKKYSFTAWAGGQILF